jgi:RNA binding exosome subunit
MVRKVHIVMTCGLPRTLNGSIQSLEVSYLVHATEDGDRIEAAVLGCFGSLGGAKEEVMEGHFGNKIVRVSHHVTGEDAGRAFATVVSKMDPGLRRQLRDELGKHLDEHSAFYVRFDKQGLIEGRLGLTDSDPIRLRVKPRIYIVKGGAASLFARLLS